MFKQHKKYLIATGLVAVFSALSVWLVELTKESPNRVDQLLKEADWGTFLGYVPVMAILLTLAAAALPLFIAFGNKMGKFSKNFSIFLALWLVAQSVVYVFLLTPPDVFVSEFTNSVAEFGRFITPLPLLVGYIMLCVWFGYIIANTASRKGKSWDSFFWLTILFGPLIMWIVTSLLTPEENEARGTVRRSSAWENSTTKQLTAAENAFARFVLLFSGGLLLVTTLSMMSDAAYLLPEVFQPANLIFELRVWFIVIELLAFTAFTFSWSWKKLFARLGIKKLTWTNIKDDSRTGWAAIALLAVFVGLVVTAIVLIVSSSQGAAENNPMNLKNVVPKDGSCAGSISKECGATFVYY